MKYRVFELPDGSLAILRPNPRLRLPKETDTAFLNRIATADAERAGLAGLPFRDVDESALPPRMATDDTGTAHPCRNAWRLRNGKVLVDAAALSPAARQKLTEGKIALPDNVVIRGLP